MSVINTPITYEGKTVTELLLATELNQLTPGRVYWITDALLSEGLWVYAKTNSSYEVLSPAGRLIRDLHLRGHAIVADQSDGSICGLMAADETERKMWVIGTDKLIPDDYDDANLDVEIAASRLVLHANSLEALLAGAQIGSPLEVAAIINGHAVLRAGTPPVPAFEISDSDASDVPIPSTDTWTQIGVDILAIPQELPVGTDVRYELYIANSGLSSGTITVGFEFEDAVGNPGVWTPSGITLPHDIKEHSAGLYTGAFRTQTILPLGANIRMLVKAVGDPTVISFGTHLFYGSSIAAVPSGGFRTDSNKPVSTSQFRLSKLDNSGIDVGSLLLDLDTSAPLTAYRSVGNTTYAITSVSDQGDAVDVFVSGGAGNNSNWSGDASFEGQLASGVFTAIVSGSIYPQNLSFSIPGTGTGSVDALKLRGKDLHASVANPADGDILVFRIAGDSWVLEAKPASGSNPALGDITDVELTAVADNEPLGYDMASAKWTNQTPEELGLARDTHNHAGVYEPVDATLLRETDIHPTPINGSLSNPISSDWAFDHAALVQAHGISAFGSSVVAAIDAAAARVILDVDQAGVGNAADIEQDDIAARISPGLGPYTGLGAANFVQEPSPAGGHLLLGWAGGALRTFDIGDLPSPPAAADIDQHDIAARIAAGTGPYAGLGAADIAEEGSPAGGHLLLGWVAGALHTFDIANLPAGTRTGIYRTLYIDAAAMAPQATDGAEAGTEECAAPGITHDHYLFDSITEEAVQFKLTAPDAWDLGAVKAKLVWSAPTGAQIADGVTWGVSIQAVNDGDACNLPFPASTEIDDAVIDVDRAHVSAPSAALAISGTPALGSLLLFRISRVVSSGNDTMAQDAKLLGIQLQYKEAATEPVSW